jgi:PAS domain S-box-containing protein
MEEALRDQRQLLETVLDNMPAMVSMLDSRGHVVYLNRECQRVLGWTEQEIREHPDILGEIYPDPAQKELAVKFIADAARTWAEWRMITRHGRIVNAAWMYLRVGDLLLGIGIDLSDRRRVQEDWRRIRHDLETKVERQYRSAAPYGLTFRELTVLSLVAGGKTDREIADTLSIGYRTVQSHISSILSKMDARARTEAGVRAVREGIVD